MPNAVVHVLFSIIILDLFRDHFLKNKKSMPLHYILIGGIAGLIPDIDIPLYWFLSSIGFDVPFFHRVFTHTLLFLSVFIIAALVFLYINRKASEIFGIISYGIAVHIFLDWLFTGGIAPFYPFSNYVSGVDLFGMTGLPAFSEGFEAVVFLLWLWHEEKTHKISDFI